VFIDNLFIECSHHDTGKQAHDCWVFIAARENFQGRYKKMLLLNRHTKMLPIIAKLKKSQNHIKETLLLIWSLVETEDRSRAVSPTWGPLQERDKNWCVWVLCICAPYKIELVISVHLSTTLVNCLHKVIKTALLQ
jgi:hypothetical protein